MLRNRLQVLIDDERLARLEREAESRRVPVSVLVRDAIDAAYPSMSSVREEALARILAAEPMEVGSVSALRRELDEVRDRWT